MTRKTKSMQLIDQHVGRKIKWYRIERGLSQEELSSKLGISYQQLHKYENGSNSASASRLAEIANALHIAAAQFFEGFGEENIFWFPEESNREQLQLAKYFNSITSDEQRRALQTLITCIGKEKIV